MKRRIHIDSSKSPFNFLKRKKEEKDKKQSNRHRIKTIDENNLDFDELYTNSNFSPSTYEPTPKMNMLLKMMYLEDVDSEKVKTKMKISDNELYRIVENLIDMGLVQNSSNDEVELTMEGIYYITSNNMDIF